MSLADLNEHVLGEILCFCDVYSVLRFSQLSKFCQRMASSKHVWISLIRDLEFRGLRDRDPGLELETCTTQALIDMAKRVALGPLTWASTSAVPPKLAREVVVRLDKSFEPFEDAPFRDANVHLLPGGTHLAMFGGSGDRLLVFEVATGRCIWTYQTPDRIWSMDVRDGGAVVIFAFEFCGVGTQPGYIDVIEVNLLTTESFLALHFPLSVAHTRFCLSGDFLLPGILSKTRKEVQIVNWRANTGIRLSFPTAIMSAMLIGNHILVVHQHDPVAQCLSVGAYALTPDLEWRSDFSSNSFLVAQSPVASLILPLSYAVADINPEIFVQKHTTQRNAYRIILKVYFKTLIPRRPKSVVHRLWNKIRRPEPAADAITVLRLTDYTLLFTAASSVGGRAAELTLVSTIPQTFPRQHSFSGYFLAIGLRDTGPVNVVLSERYEDGWNGLRRREVMQWPQAHPESSPWPFLGTYEAAVVLVEERTARIMYYE